MDANPIRASSASTGGAHDPASRNSSYLSLDNKILSLIENKSPADVDLVYRSFRDHAAFCRSSLIVETESGVLVPMELGPGQLRLAEAIKRQRTRGVPVRLIYLKSRRIQATTGTAAHFFQQTAFSAGVHTAVIAHDDTSTRNIFSIYKRFYERYRPFAGLIRMGPSAGPTSDKIEFEYAGDPESSFIQIKTAGSVNFGRSFRLTNVHFSEFPYYDRPAQLLASVMSAVPKTADTTAVIEGTAKTIARRGNSPRPARSATRSRSKSARCRASSTSTSSN